MPAMTRGSVIARLSEGKPWQSLRDCFVALLLAMTAL